MTKRSWTHAWDKVRDEGQCRACGSTEIVDREDVAWRL